ncbi:MULTISPECIES: TetR/AcrR family transcriptional regulator [unclassified Microbacterium]|uniref:TetR/AcrR family transcriptional regulator n=1 Tax=unclassified Microbacterium TaxID=2609290 RepID=UPI00214B3E28|nr:MULTISPECIES: TetR/AcrR family transcriptional regulator [unclassified Microbacterium]MCR2811290.1 TetR/AcrR family transcriptional regulator [Microbacterium sp. zg.B185]WIM19448.1 TetR/AcrR family transcriptional regulator [Microbacterium sp. zg-B185]
MHDQPTLPGRPRASTRSAISATALRLFSTHGFASTTVEQIATAAGISRSTFFNYFSSKAETIWNCQEHQLAALETDLATADDGDPFEIATRAVVGVASDVGPVAAEPTRSYGALIASSPTLALESATWPARRAVLVGRYIARRLGLSDDDLLAQSYAHALNGAISAAAINFGNSRGRRLSDILAESTTPVQEGFSNAWRTAHPIGV